MASIREVGFESGKISGCSVAVANDAIRNSCNISPFRDVTDAR